jgi:hypothetical protein
VALRSEPYYQGPFSDDLSSGIFRAWTPITDAPDVADMVNLYVRDDLLTAGPGSYKLVTACPACVAPIAEELRTAKPEFAGASEDFEHLVFESALNLTADAPAQPFLCSLGVFTSCEKRVYEWGGGDLRLASVLPTGVAATRGIAGRGVSVQNATRVTSHPISADGNRIVYTAPTSATAVSGALYMRVNGRTTIQLNPTERAPGREERPQAATYWDASSDHADVFFTSGEALTDETPVSSGQKLYRWARADHDEVQQVAVDATGGTFTLSFNGASTGALAFDASSDTVRRSLEDLRTIKAGNVAVSGGPGNAGATTPYEVTFTVDFAGANVAQLTAAGAGLTGGGASASVRTTTPVTNVTYLNVDEEDADSQNNVRGVVGASADGSYVYFVTTGQLVDGAPPLGPGFGLYAWHEGTIAYVGEVTTFDTEELFDGVSVGLLLKQARVTRDGRHLLFRARSGSGLLSAHGGVDRDHAGFDQLYLYGVDTDELDCISCAPSGAPSTAVAVATSYVLTGGALQSTYVNRSLSHDGRFAFFNTREALVPEDVNNRVDAYEYDIAAGSAHLLSTGTDPSDSFFLDASSNGDDAFFITREQLVGWDTDQGYDLYDARVGGGFPEPMEAASTGCRGDAGQGALVPAPDAAGASSAAYRGSGNAAGSPSTPSARAKRKAKRKRAGTRCKRGKVKRHVRGKVRCLTRRQARRAAHRRAMHRRAARPHRARTASDRRAK